MARVSILRFTLASFLVSANFLTGIALYSLIALYIQILQAGDRLEVDLWGWRNPSTDFLVVLGQRIAVFASIYIMLSILSVLLSSFSVSAILPYYFLFSILVFSSTFLVPVFPIIRKLQEEKREALHALDVKLQEQFRSITESPDRGAADEKLDQIDQLFGVREQIESAVVWPFKLRSLGTAMWIGFVSAIPVLAEFFLGRL